MEIKYRLYPYLMPIKIEYAQNKATKTQIYMYFYFFIILAPRCFSLTLLAAVQDKSPYWKLHILDPIYNLNQVYDNKKQNK